MGRSHYAHARQSDSKASISWITVWHRENVCNVGQYSEYCGTKMLWRSIWSSVASTRRPWVTTLGIAQSAWKTLCHEAVTQFEDSRVEALANKRAVRKGAQPRSNLSAWLCDSCSSVCSSRIGLHAHQQTHRWHAILRFRRRSPFRSIYSKSKSHRNFTFCTRVARKQIWSRKFTRNKNVQIVFAHILHDYIFNYPGEPHAETDILPFKLLFVIEVQVLEFKNAFSKFRFYCMLVLVMII